MFIQKKRLAVLYLLMSFAFTVHAQNDAAVINYINKYKTLAMSEQQRSGIPAAITLAQGIHETTAGSSELATMANNHFGIKCKKNWTGQTFAHTDDAPNECFRKYNRAEDSYKDHSDYLVASVRYASLFKLSMTDYAGWAYGLKQCGYATNPRYAQILIKYIEDYHLQEYTYTAIDKNNLNAPAITKAEIVPEHDPVPAAKTIQQPQITEIPKNKPKVTEPLTAPVVPPVAATKPIASPVIQRPVNAPAYGTVVKVNGLKAIYVKKGDTPLEYAYKHNIRYTRLLEINEIDERPFPADMYLYLERKNFKGMRPMHMVKPGETLFLISQAEGVQIKYLRSMNMLAADEEPVPGSVLELQAPAKNKPMVTVVKKEPQPVSQQPGIAVQTKPATIAQPVKQVPKPAQTIANTTVPAQQVKAPAVAVTKPADTFVPQNPKNTIEPVKQVALATPVTPAETLASRVTNKPVVPSSEAPDNIATDESTETVQPIKQIAASVQATPGTIVKTAEIKAPVVPTAKPIEEPVPVEQPETARRNEEQAKEVVDTKFQEPALKPEDIAAEQPKQFASPVQSDPVAESAAPETIKNIPDNSPKIAKSTSQEIMDSGEDILKFKRASEPGVADSEITEILINDSGAEEKNIHKIATPVTDFPAKEPLKTETEAPAPVSKPVAVGPNLGIPEKKAEPVKTATIATPNIDSKVPSTTSKIAEPSKTEEPKDELTLLKEKFDRVVYAKSNTTPQSSAEESIKTEVKNEEAKPGGPSATDDSPLATSKDPAKYYTVKKGDTAFSIAKEHNITMRQLMNWNGLDFDAIKIGQKLRVKP